MGPVNSAWIGGKVKIKAKKKKKEGNLKTQNANAG